MTADEYLAQVLARQTVDTGVLSPVRTVQGVLDPIIREWAGNKLLNVFPSGSFAKGTAIKSGTDIDIFISLSEQTTETLKDVYEKLFARMQAKGYSPKRQNVSINVRLNGYDVDLVPAKRQNALTLDHSLYRRRADTWTKTNVIQHINHVIAGGRLAETRVLKAWRNQKGIDFPSFYLELTVINALAGRFWGTLPQNVWTVFEYLRDKFPTARVVDPANSNNVISDDLSGTGRLQIKAAAEHALKAPVWEQIVV